MKFYRYLIILNFTSYTIILYNKELWNRKREYKGIVILLFDKLLCKRILIVPSFYHELFVVSCFTVQSF